MRVLVQRFTKNNWYLEKNPTIVTFPLTNLEMRDCASCLPLALSGCLVVLLP